MEIYTTGRPSMPLTPACAQFPASAAVAHRASLSRVHQVQIQAELGQAKRRGGEYGTKVTLMGRDGFVGSNGSVIKTDGASGVPPRGRPV
ncbi:hypothetical protein [Actinoplanes sp. NPDC049265]|uniref:hypothetical protein n=1 Tax=Actinoplanes sp. NPDC049265 TaxID=3363902 RepID=UPI00371E9B5D